MKKNYQNPTTICIAIEASILCASGAVPNPGGSLESIGKGSGTW